MMRQLIIAVTAFLLAVGLGLTVVSNSANAQSGSEWISLFDGETLDGWKASENPETFSVSDGVIVADGQRSHLFYIGEIQNHNFKNFEFKADVKADPASNSGIYFHTEYQDSGWPAKGYEAQVNNSGSDPRKTGSLYAIEDVEKAPAEDGEWFTMYIKVQGDHITIKVDGKTTVEYTEPDQVERPENMAGRLLSSGTFALQGHDPESTVYYKNIMVKPLPEE